MKFIPKLPQQKNMPLWLKSLVTLLVISALVYGVNNLTHSSAFSKLVKKFNTASVIDAVTLTQESMEGNQDMINGGVDVNDKTSSNATVVDISDTLKKDPEKIDIKKETTPIKGEDKKNITESNNHNVLESDSVVNIPNSNPTPNIQSNVVINNNLNNTNTPIIILPGAPSNSGYTNPGNTDPGDTEAPVVKMTYPAPNQLIFGSIDFMSLSSDNVGVASLVYEVDGVVVSEHFDTTSVSNGLHSVHAVAKDVANNKTISFDVPFEVYNVSDADNLILNPSLEISDANGQLINWHSGGWGTNDALFEYPVVGIHGDKAVKVSISNYVDGDGKWYFDDVAISGGIEYVYSESYKANTSTTLMARYTYTDGSQNFEQVAVLPPTGDTWSFVKQEIETNPNAVAITIFHVLNSVGELTTDNFSLVAKYPNSDSLDHGVVSLTFDDGWISHYTNALPILASHGMKGSFYIISGLAGSIPNLVNNPSLENDNAGIPDGWVEGYWGTNDSSFEYPVAGYNTDKAVKVSISNYTDGDAKWVFADVATNEDQVYRFAEKYKSTTSTKITARYTYADSTVEYSDLATLPSTGGQWKSLDMTFYSPANISSITLFNRLDSAGEITIDDVVVKENSFYVSQEEIVEIKNAGHEVGSHTITHPFLTQLDEATAQAELVNSKSTIESIIGGTVTTLAYPYGDTNASVKSMAQNAGYTLARGVQAGFNSKSADKFDLRVQSVNVDTPLSIVKSWIDAANNAHVWLILMFHQVDHEGETYSVTPENLQSIVDYLATTNTDVKTVKDVLPLLN